MNDTVKASELTISREPMDESAELSKISFRYCVLIVLLPVLAVPFFILLGSSDFFIRHGASVWVRSNDAVFDMHDRECDVVVYGDSTAMTGIDPDLVEERTGFRTCNIAVTNAVLAVTNNLTLDRFLAQNSKPRVILVQLSPDGFQAENHAWDRTIYAEGLLELLRHGKPGDVRRVMFTHPEESVSFAGYAAGFSAWYFMKDVWFHATHLRSEEDTVMVRNGFFTPPSPARTSCAPATSVVSDDARQSKFSRSLVADYRNSYSNRAGLVLINVAPIPACDQNLAAFQAQLDGVTSNSLVPLPIQYFNDGRHYTAPGSQIVSKAISNELNAVASRYPAIDDRVPAAHVVASLRRVRLRKSRE
jgi:hypothetical protein